ncbi:hypothetical protein J7I94_30155 [Streptomyces sp. ISL-12]|uniref:wHTH domain-containing protein n=1 Tax=Streptomyces sp. ISL-12 TaxID=2819177 RepID=UPI001BE623BF|nr:hypothetical protein [Streptomyces sp. ISL-12]MBT2414761.1 hypothetical protein [Streptomyces sp. ISL-12]
MPKIPLPDDPAARVLVSADLTGEAPWLDPDRPVPAHHVLRAAGQRRLDRADVTARLTELGYRVPPPELLASLTDDDTKLLTRDLDGRPPWLTTADFPYLRAHVLRAARKLGRPPAELADRCAALGLALPGSDRLPESVDDDDLKLISPRLSGRPWLCEEDAPRLRSLAILAAVQLKRPPGELADRLAELGYRAPSPDTFPDRAEDDDRHLVLKKSGFLLADTEPVPLGHALRVLPSLRHRTDAPKTPRESAAAVAALGERFTALGFRVGPGLAETGPDDLVLVSEGLDGQAPWLDAGQPVPLHHVLRFAQAHGRDPHKVIARLRDLGHRRLPDGPPAGSVTAEDLDLIEGVWRGRTSRPQQHGPDLLPHLLVVCVRTGRAPAEAADRLRRLGYALPARGVPAEARESDLRLISPPVQDDSAPWISWAEPVPVGHVLYRAHSEGMNVGAVVARLRELGHDRVPELPDRVVTDDDLRLITDQREGGPAPLTDTVPYGRVVRAAEEAGTGVLEAAQRYRELGYTDVVLPDDPSAGPVGAGAAALVRTDTGWLDPDALVPPRHIIRRARAEGTGPAGIGRRLRALGYRHLPGSLPEESHPDDLEIISQYGLGKEFLDPGRPVDRAHPRDVAHRLGISAYEVASRLVALGHRLPFVPLPEDALILSQNADGDAPWVLSGDAGLGHVLRAARVLGRTPAEIDERLGEYGYAQHTLPELDGFDDVDILVLSQGLDGRAPWLPWRRTPAVEHVLRAARATGDSPVAIAERLTRLGHAVELPVTADADDLEVALALPKPNGPLKMEEVLTVVGRLGLSPAETARRLTALGVGIPDVTYPDRRPAPTRPRRP